MLFFSEKNYEFKNTFRIYIKQEIFKF